MRRYGRWALVTGASRGIGCAFAKQLAAAGYDVLLVALEADLLEERAREIRELHGRQVRALAGDLGEAAFCAEVIAQSDTVEVGVAVCCAGYGMIGYFIQHEVEEYLQMLKVNDEATLRIAHHLVRRWYASRSRGGLVIVSSANADAHGGIPFSTVYSASKSFLKLVAQGLHYEMKPHGIDVLSVSPGPTDTDFQERANSNRLFFVESPESVAVKTLRRLGRGSSITTNPVSRAIVFVHNHVPSESLRMAMRAFFFGRVIGKREAINLDGLR